MIKGTTSKGFRFNISKKTLDDWELLELVAEMEKGNVLSIIQFAKKLLGTNQYNQLKKYCKKDGIVSTSLMQETLIEIFSNTNETKN